MVAFLIISDAIFLTCGILFLFFPKTVVTLSKLANQVLVYTDEKVYVVRKIMGVICLALVVFLTVAIMLVYHLI